jgi:hypothetical protein
MDIERTSFSAFLALPPSFFAFPPFGAIVRYYPLILMNVMGNENSGGFWKVDSKDRLVEVEVIHRPKPHLTLKQVMAGSRWFANACIAYELPSRWAIYKIHARYTGVYKKKVLLETSIFGYPISYLFESKNKDKETRLTLHFHSYSCSWSSGGITGPDCTGVEPISPIASSSSFLSASRSTLSRSSFPPWAIRPSGAVTDGRPFLSHLSFKVKRGPISWRRAFVGESNTYLMLAPEEAEEVEEEEEGLTGDV